MKKNAITIVFLLFGIFIIAQTVNTKTALSTTTESTAFAVAPLKMALFYIGIDNPIEIAICGYAAKNITATVDNGTVTNLGNGKFIVKLKTAMTSTKVHVFINTNGKATKIGERLFRVKRVPDPVPSIAGIKSGSISKSLLMAATGIIPSMENFDFDITFRVTSFSFLIKKGTDIIAIPVQGSSFTQQIKTLIASSPLGTRVYIEDIKVIDPDGSPRTLNSMILTLK